MSKGVFLDRLIPMPGGRRHAQRRGEEIGSVRRGVAMLALALAACSAQALEEAGIDCDPIAYQLENEVWVLTAGAKTRLSESGYLGFNPALSSDGNRVAFTSGKQGGGDLDLYVINSDGSNRQSLWGVCGVPDSRNPASSRLTDDLATP